MYRGLDSLFWSGFSIVLVSQCSKDLSECEGVYLNGQAILSESLLVVNFWFLLREMGIWWKLARC